jgi:hypothetical protein
MPGGRKTKKAANPSYLDIRDLHFAWSADPIRVVAGS